MGMAIPHWLRAWAEYLVISRCLCGVAVILWATNFVAATLHVVNCGCGDVAVLPGCASVARVVGVVA
jgi:hypothetical protein